MITETKGKCCTKCLIVKTAKEFSNNKRTNDKLTAHCKTCMKEYKKLARQENPEKLKAQSKAQRLKNLEKCREYNRNWNRNNVERCKVNGAKWQKDNPDKVREYARLSQRKNKDKNYHRVRKWQKDNPDKVNALSMKKKANKLKCCPPWAQEKSIYKDMLSDVYRQCRELSKESGVLHHVDHITPLQPPKVIMFEGEMIALVCGLHVPANLQILTATENMTKHNKFEVWIESESV